MKSEYYLSSEDGREPIVDRSAVGVGPSPVTALPPSSDSRPGPLTVNELRALHLLEEIWIAQDYWTDPTIDKFRTQDLVHLAEGRIVLTDKGRDVAKHARNGLQPALRA